MVYWETRITPPFQSCTKDRFSYPRVYASTMTVANDGVVSSRDIKVMSLRAATFRALGSNSLAWLGRERGRDLLRKIEGRRKKGGKEGLLLSLLLLLLLCTRHRTRMFPSLCRSSCWSWRVYGWRWTTVRNVGGGSLWRILSSYRFTACIWILATFITVGTI